MKNKVHYENGGWPLCNAANEVSVSVEMTPDEEKVTCKTCVKRLKVSHQELEELRARRAL